MYTVHTDEIISDICDQQQSNQLNKYLVCLIECCVFGRFAIRQIHLYIRIKCTRLRGQQRDIYNWTVWLHSGPSADCLPARRLRSLQRTHNMPS